MHHRLHLLQLSYTLLPIHAGIVATFALVPVWFRLPNAPGSFDPLYSTGFAIFWAMLWTVGWWLVTGLPGFRKLRRDRLRCWWALILMLLAGWAFLSWSWAYIRFARPEIAIGAAIPFALAALFALVVACAAPRLRVIIAVLVIGLLVNSLIGGWQVARQGPISVGLLGEFNIDPARTGISVVQADGVRWLRPYGFLPHPNILAGFLAVGLLAVVNWILAEGRRQRWIGVGVFLIGWWALLLTFSRSAWIGLAAGGFAILPVLWPRIRQPATRATILPFMLFVIGASALFAALYLPFLTARAGLEEESVELRSVSDRIVFADMAVRAIQESPILGIGMGNFPWRSSAYLKETDYDLRGGPVHQIFLSVWSELGIIGYSLIVLVIVLGVEVGMRRITTPPSPLSINREGREKHLGRGEGLRPSPTEADSGSAIPIAERDDWHRDRIARATMLGGVIALMMIGLLDHYPWTLLHFQGLWFGLLAAAGTVKRPPLPSRMEPQ